ncbi:MAG: SIR2 family protein [Planctomycetota bacterium]|nr:SIR2 family protein [Planctomycetota bacterium]
MPELSPDSLRILLAIKTSLERNAKPTTHDNFLWRLDGYTQLLRLNQSDEALREFLRDRSKLADLHICTEQAIGQITSTTIMHYTENRVERARSTDSRLHDAMATVLSLYYKLAQLNGPHNNLPIYTTNYDLLLEDLHQGFKDPDANGVTLANGFSDYTQESETWHSTNYHTRIDKPTISLYRLHGCASWFYHDRADPNVYFHRRDARGRLSDDLCAMYPGHESHRGIDPYATGFRSLYSCMTECDIIIFIGFSFRDDDVMHLLLKACTQRKRPLKMLIVDPLYNADDVRHALDAASHRSAFPVEFPLRENMLSLKMYFGDDESFDKTILTTCSALID